MRFYLFILFAAFFCHAKSELEQIHDDELVNLMRSEKYLVVLFATKQCPECDSYENQLTAIREDLVEVLNAWVVKLIDSSMTRLYTPKKVSKCLGFLTHLVTVF